MSSISASTKPPSTPTRTIRLVSPSPSPSSTATATPSSSSSTGTATPSHLFLTRTRSLDPFLRSHIPEQVLYASGEAPNRMSVFGFLSSQPPPVYNNPPLLPTEPEMYKASLDIQPSPLSSHPLPPPPVYQPRLADEKVGAGNTVENGIRIVDEDEEAEKEGEVEVERPSMSEPPRYDSQAEKDRVEERRRNRDSIVKDKMVETSSDGVLVSTGTGAGEKEVIKTTEDRKAKEEDAGWCGCLSSLSAFWNPPKPRTVLKKKSVGKF